jgi:hypothetical protein
MADRRQLFQQNLGHFPDAKNVALPPNQENLNE